LSLRLFNLNVQLPLVLLAIGEAAMLVVAPFLVEWLGWGSFGERFQPISRPMLAGSVVFALFGFVCLMAVGLYSTRQRNNAANAVVRLLLAYSSAVALAAFFYYLLPEIGIGRRTLVVAGGLAVVGSMLVRLVGVRLLDDQLFKRRVLVFGAGRRAANILALRRRSDTRGFHLVAFVAAEGDEIAVPADRLIRRPPDLFHWSQENRIDEIVLAMDDRRREFPMEELLECRLAGTAVLELPGFLERETGKVRLDVLNPSWIVLGEGFSDSGFQRLVGRAFDVLMSLVLLIVALPIMLLTAIGIRLEDRFRAPVLYRQTRVGLYNQPFEVLKFRSMTQDAETNGPVWAVPDDPRITKVGAFIRKARIDELPQLINVLRGEMSFVGPRPERPEFVEQLAKCVPYYRSRHAVKPGITGWAQLCYSYGASDEDALEKLQYDLFYVKHRSLIFDLAIVVQTVEVVLWGKGAR
jgi:sugar transferase (PEP-CTERM system associated)